MKNSFGTNVIVTLFGESHGEQIGVVIDGLAPGIEVNDDFINSQLDKRRPKGKISTSRVEADKYQIVSGVVNGRTTGTPICILIPNTNTKSSDYEKLKTVPRPGHADYTACCKYHGFQDPRGGGHFSGRITAPLVAAGAIAIDALAKKGIVIGSHIARCAGVDDKKIMGSNLAVDNDELKKILAKLNEADFALIDDSVKSAMIEKMEAAAAEGDSVGGVLETAIAGLPAGIGEPWFDTFESVMSHMLFSVPAIKGVEFGDGFAMTDMMGSQSNDSFYMDGDKVKTKTNHNGGINGGITNGMPVVFSCAVKPTPSIYKKQDSVNLKEGKNEELVIEGRHDPAIIHRARVVVDSVVALVLVDMLSGRYGTDYLAD